MSNRKKPRRLRKVVQEAALHKIPAPEEREVIKQVPAIIHWGQVPNIDREDDETIGEALLYDDDTKDVVIWTDISDDAKKLLYGVSEGVDHFSIMGEENDGAAEQE